MYRNKKIITKYIWLKQYIMYGDKKKKITKCIWLKHDIFENILSIKLSAFTVILELL